MSYTQESYYQKEVLVSEILESHGIPDPYYWKIKKRKFVSRNDKTETPIENVIIVDNPVGWAEYKAFQKIQEKAIDIEEGSYFIWISPIHSVYYPKTSKIIITQKVGDLFLNRSINTKWNSIDSILIARELAGLSDMDPNIFKNTMDVRENPIFINKDKEEFLGLALRRMLDKKSLEMMETGEDFRVKETYINDLREGRRVQMGNEPRSCEISMTRSAFQVFAGEDEYGSLQFDCPNENCKKKITREPGKLISNCPHCGCDVRCGSSKAS